MDDKYDLMNSVWAQFYLTGPWVALTNAAAILKL